MTGATLTDEETETLAQVIYEKYLEQWRRLFEVYLSEYDPTHNYDLNEKGERDDKTTLKAGTTETIDRNRKNNQTAEVTETFNNYKEHVEEQQKHPETVTTTGERVNTNQVSPEDVDTWMNTTKSQDAAAIDRVKLEGEDSTTRDTTHTGSKTTATGYTGDADTEHEHTQRGGQDLTEFLGKHTLRRFGNIGVTTTQQLLQSELSLWEGFNFWDIINEMAARELTANFY